MFALPKLKSFSYEWLDKQSSNMTLGIHVQDWLSNPDPFGNRHPIHEVIIGLFFIRFTFEFIRI